MRIEVHPDSQWASEVGRRLAQRVADRPAPNICLPTGNTPVPAYASFMDEGGDLGHATVFLLDEFVLPEGSPGRCDAMLSEGLLDLLDHPPARVVGWDTTGDLDEAADAMERAIEDAGGLDLVLLGLGTNGHIGVNEPGSSAVSRSRQVEIDQSTADGALRYGAPTRPTRGLTMGIGTLLEASEVWLLVTGQGKADILARTMHGPIGPDIPATFLRTHPNAVVIADESAATGLR